MIFFTLLISPALLYTPFNLQRFILCLLVAHILVYISASLEKNSLTLIFRVRNIAPLSEMAKTYISLIKTLISTFIQEQIKYIVDDTSN